MSAPEIKVGDVVAVIELTCSLVQNVTVTSETPAMWITSSGERYRKRDGARVPRYLETRRRIVTVADYNRARESR